jgi:thiol-disulfide isomerase/thioredoxin/Ni/Co efflux regulator RcnB
MIVRQYGWLLMLIALFAAIAFPSSINAQDEKKTDETKQDSRKKDDDDEDDKDQDDDDDKEKPELRELFAEAQGFLRDGDYEEGLDVLRKARKFYPKNAQVSLALMQVLQQVGLQNAEEDRKAGNKYFYESAEIAREVLKDKKIPARFRPLMASQIYNEACSLAVEGKDEKALKVLQESFAAGFDNFELAREDEDFGELLEKAEFKKIVDEAEKAAKDRAKKELEKKVAATLKEMQDFKSFDFNFELKSSTGDDVKLADYEGRFLIVDFWGTWCGPCIAEIPHFIKLKKTYQEKGLDIVGIAYENTEDADEAAEMVNKFIKQRKVNYPSLIGDNETSSQVDLDGYPTTLFIGKDGIVKFKLVGYHQYEVLEAVAKELMKDEMNK